MNTSSSSVTSKTKTRLIDGRRRTANAVSPTYNTNPSIPDVCEFFWAIERQYGLLDLEFSGWPTWQHARIQLYYDLLVQLDIGDPPHPNNPTQKPGLVTRLWQLCRSLVTENPLMQLSKCDLMMLEHARVQKSGDYWIDIYSHFLEEEWDTSGKNWRAITNSYQKQYRKKSHPRRYHLTALELLIRLLEKRPIKLSVTELNTISDLENELNRVFGIKWGLKRKIEKHTRSLAAATTVFRLLLRLWRPRELFVIVSYDNRHSAAIYAAHQLGIPVTEIQHGTINKYHLGYSYPDRHHALPCFPDRFLAWSSAWAASAPFSPQLAATEIRPFDWLESRKSRYASVRKQHAVIVISQGLLGDRIAAALLGHIRRWNGYDIRYKLHPSEYDSWRSYRHLVELVEQHGVTVLEQCDLYQQFAECEEQVGVFSTALYEGMEFNCKTFVLDLPGVEYMSGLIEAGHVELLPGKPDI